MPISRKALEANGFANIGRFGRICKQTCQMQAKIDGSAGSPGGGDLVVSDDTLVGQDVGKLPGDREMGGVAACGQEPAVKKDHRGGADRREPTTRGVLLQDQFTDPRVRSQVFHPSAAGQENEVIVASQDSRQRGVGVRGDAAASGDMNPVGQRGGGDLNAGTAQQIHGRKGLDFLKSFGKRNEYGRHNG